MYPCWPYRFHFTREQQFNEFRKHVIEELLRNRVLRAALAGAGQRTAAQFALPQVEPKFAAALARARA